MGNKLVNELKTAVFSKREVLEQIYNKFGRLSLSEYVQKWQESQNIVSKELLEVLKECYAEIYGTEIAEQVSEQIKNTSLVSTVDHHGFLNHPFFLNSNLIFSLRAKLKFLPVLSTNGVSLNNSSWPGALCLNNVEKNILEKFSFFKDKHKTKTVFSLAGYQENEVLLLLERVSQSSFLSVEQKQVFHNLVVEIFLNPKILEQKYFSTQACQVSVNLWHKVFPNAPKLAYLPLEDLVNKVLLKMIIPDTAHVLHKLFFQEKGLNLIEKYFIGLKGAFGGNKGSFLFWGVDTGGRRVALKREGSKLISLDGTLTCELNSASLEQAILLKQIYPTSLMCFLVMLYYGLNCLGGFNQTSWLTSIKEKFISLLLEFGEKQPAEVIKSTITDNFSETTVLIAKKYGKYFKPSLLDLYLNNISFEKCLEQVRKITLAQSIESELPEMYKIVVEDIKREQKLKELSLGEIIQENKISVLEL